MDIFPEVISETAWLLMLGVSAFGVKFLRDLSRSVDRLNIHIGDVIDSIAHHEHRLNDHESRLGRLENGRMGEET